jgi:hypothetical protein
MYLEGVGLHVESLCWQGARVTMLGVVKEHCCMVVHWCRGLE